MSRERVKSGGANKRRMWLGGALAALLATATACLGGGCSTGASSTAIPDHRIVAFQLDGSSLKPIAAYVPSSSTGGNLGPSNITHRKLSWTYVDADGRTIATGTVPDGRVVTTEFLADGTPAPASHAAGTTFTVSIPSSAGQLRVTDDQGNRVAKAPMPEVTAVDPAPAPGYTPRPNDGSHLSPAPEQDPNAPAGLQKIVESTVPCPFNIVFAPEAWTDMEAFHAVAGEIADYVKNSPEYGPHGNVLQFWTQDIVSQDTTIRDPARPDVNPNTAFSMAFGGGPDDPMRRAIYTPGGTPVPDATTAILTDAIRYARADIIFVIVNTAEYGGVQSEFLGIRYVTTTTNEAHNQVALHELGHGTLSLADEYDYGTCDHNWTEAINTSAKLDDLPWKDLVTLPVPTPDGTEGIGAFAGAHYCKAEEGVYRPSSTCLMKELSSTWCAVCKRAYEQTFGPRDVDGGADAGSSGDPGAGDDPNSGNGDQGGSLTTGADASLTGGPVNLVCPTHVQF